MISVSSRVPQISWPVAKAQGTFAAPRQISAHVTKPQPVGNRRAHAQQIGLERCRAKASPYRRHEDARKAEPTVQQHSVTGSGTDRGTIVILTHR